MKKGIIPDINELLAYKSRVAEVNLFNNKRINSINNGNFISFSKGKGMDFDEVRRYNHGDDIRLIHWPLTARLGKTYTKIYKEEKEREVYFVIDQSPTMHFGTRCCFKNVLAANMCSLLGWSAIENSEKVGGFICDNNKFEFIKPLRNRKSLLAIFRLLINNNLLSNYNGDINESLKLLYKKVTSGSLVIILSDFFSLNEEGEKYLKLLVAKNDVMNIFLYDIIESELPKNSLLTFTNSDSSILEIFSNNKNRLLYEENFLNRFNRIKNLSNKNGIKFLSVKTNDNLLYKINEVSFYGK